MTNGQKEIKTCFTVDLIMMLWLLKNSTFLVAIHFASDIIKTVRTIFQNFRRSTVWRTVWREHWGKKWCETEVLEMALEKKSRLTRSIVIKLHVKDYDVLDLQFLELEWNHPTVFSKHQSVAPYKISWKSYANITRTNYCELWPSYKDVLPPSCNRFRAFVLTSFEIF